VPLRAIVSQVGGSVSANGTQANIPAPGHSARDRSVSLRYENGRVVVHCFSGNTQWREVLDWLRRLALIDADNAVTAGGPAGLPAAPAVPLNARARIDVASRIWEGGRPIAGTLAARHLSLRHVSPAVPLPDASVARFRHDTPVSVYGRAGYRQPALLVAIRDKAGDLSGLEITYLSPSGRRAVNLRLNRKMVGETHPNTAMRIMPAAPSMLVAEGFFTTLSAMHLLGRPGWALHSIRNLITWEPPAIVRDVLIAGDNGAGEKAAVTLMARLSDRGVAAKVTLPPPSFDDWNDYASNLAQGQTDATGAKAQL